jgi:hypothetical protein
VKRESEIQEKVTKWAYFNGLLPVRINVTGRKGWPDYGYGYKAHMCFIEFKRPGAKPEPLQAHVHGVLKEYGFKVYVVDDIDVGIKLLENWKNGIDNGEYVAEVR